jgi:hypothetical protein
MQKAATPLNEVCTAPVNRASRHARTAHTTMSDGGAPFLTFNRRTEFNELQKALWRNAF